eukprot:4514783-Prymnesium_polylepis.2
MMSSDDFYCAAAFCIPFLGRAPLAGPAFDLLAIAAYKLQMAAATGSSRAALCHVQQARRGRRPSDLLNIYGRRGRGHRTAPSAEPSAEHIWPPRPPHLIRSLLSNPPN